MEIKEEIINSLKNLTANEEKIICGWRVKCFFTLENTKLFSIFRQNIGSVDYSLEGASDFLYRHRN